MSLMKWFRKNNRKIMAIAVVGLMVVFIGGTALRVSCGYSGPRAGKAFALYGQNKKLTLADNARASNELALLRNIRADYWLRSRDVHGLLLAELIFTEDRLSPQMMTQLRQLIRNNQLRISEQQLAGISKKTQRDEIYWMLLKNEAANAGVAISDQAAENILQQLIPQLFQGSSYAQLINTLSAQGISREQVLSTFAELIAVLDYSMKACSQEDLTRYQISRLADIELQRADVNFVPVGAEIFADAQPVPSGEKIEEQFNEYRKYYPGEVAAENPYGFGYKIDDLVKLQYLVVKLEDIMKTIDEPTQDEKQNYYLSHVSEFVAQRPSDPNDPNSPTTEYTMSYGQVARAITARLIGERMTQKAQEILSRAIQLAQENYGDKDAADMTAEQLKQNAADFDAIADKLSQEFGIKVYSGTTGLLSLSDMQRDINLGGLYTADSAAGLSPTGIAKLAFSAGKPADANQLAKEKTSVKLYETIGPFRDLGRRIVALVRVIDTRPAAVPDSLDISFDAKGVVLDEKQAEEKTFSVREKVIEDLKRFAAMEQAKQAAERLAAAAEKEGWQPTVEQFNKRYPTKEPNEPNNFELVSLTNIAMPSPDAEQAVKAQILGQTGAHYAINAQKREKMLLDKLFSLVPIDGNAPPQLPVIIEVEPALGYYVIKDMVVNRIDTRQYEMSKAMIAFQQNSIELRNLAATFFQPKSILERNNFRLIQKSQPIQSDEPAEPNDVQQPQES